MRSDALRLLRNRPRWGWRRSVAEVVAGAEVADIGRGDYWYWVKRRFRRAGGGFSSHQPGPVVRTGVLGIGDTR